MGLPKTIVVATDFSECAERATNYALELAQRLDARVELVHSWMVPPLATTGELAAPMGDLATVIEEGAHSAMQDALKRYQRPGLKVNGTVICNDPRDAVLQAANDLKAELIVLGTHGRRGIRRALLGSVAETVVRTAPCPVLVVR